MENKKPPSLFQEVPRLKIWIKDYYQQPITFKHTIVVTTQHDFKKQALALKLSPQEGSGFKTVDYILNSRSSYTYIFASTTQLSVSLFNTLSITIFLISQKNNLQNLKL